MAFKTNSLTEEIAYISRFDPAIDLEQSDHEGWLEAGLPTDYSAFLKFHASQTPTLFYLKPIVGHVANKIIDSNMEYRIGNTDRKNKKVPLDTSAMKMNPSNQHWEACKHSLKRISNLLDNTGNEVVLQMEHKGQQVSVVTDDCMGMLFSGSTRKVAIEIGEFALNGSSLTSKERKN